MSGRPAPHTPQAVAAATASIPTPASNLAAGTLPVGREYGQVIAINPGPPKSVTLQINGGATIVEGIRYRSSYTPTVGDYVEISVVGSDWVVEPPLA